MIKNTIFGPACLSEYFLFFFYVLYFAFDNSKKLIIDKNNKNITSWFLFFRKTFNFDDIVCMICEHCNNGSDGTDYYLQIELENKKIRIGTHSDEQSEELRKAILNIINS